MTTFFDVLNRGRNTGVGESESMNPVEPRDESATPPNDTEHLIRPAWNDIGNAQRLAARHGCDLRYCRERGAWLVWDGRRWAVDSTGRVEQFAKETAVATHKAGRRIKDDEHDTRTKFLRFAHSSQNATRLRSMVSVAQSEPEIAITATQLDANPWLLNVRNGTLDLRTAKLRPHRRTDLLTKLAPVDYDPDARCDVWDKFLADLTGGDEELQAYLQRAVGYSLTGETSEEAMFLLLGPGGSGKSTFVEAVKAMLGDYAMTASFDTFIRQQNSGGPHNDIARLKGARLVTASEVNEGRSLDSALVKSITGGDTVAARFLYCEPFEYKPQFKLWLVANHAPLVSMDDTGMWRRLHRINCNHARNPQEQDPCIKATLLNARVAGPAILTWALIGCRAWQRKKRLTQPRAVIEATSAYRAQMDPLAEFIDENCELDPSLRYGTKEFLEAYSDWARDHGAPSLTAKKIVPSLLARGCEPSQFTDSLRRGLRCWKGIGRKRHREVTQ